MISLHSTCWSRREWRLSIFKSLEEFHEFNKQERWIFLPFQSETKARHVRKKTLIDEFGLRTFVFLHKLFFTIETIFVSWRVTLTVSSRTLVLFFWMERRDRFYLRCFLLTRYIWNFRFFLFFQFGPRSDDLSRCASFPTKFKWKLNLTANFSVFLNEIEKNILEKASRFTRRTSSLRKWIS